MLKEQLELMSVTADATGKKKVMCFLDREAGEVRNVSFNKQAYVDGKYVDDEEKAAKVEEWCQTYFGTDFANLESCVGVKKDVYCYEKFNSLFEVQAVSKFTADMVGELIQTEIKEIVVDETGIRIRYDYEGKTYESKHMYATFFETTKEWFVDPVKKAQVFDKFQKKYGVPVKKCQSLIGHPAIVEVKKAFNSYYGDIKKFKTK